jgi:signal transduction histidine kinase
VDLTKALHPERPCAAVQLTVLRPDGEERHLRASVSALFGPDAALQKMVAIVHDVTADERLARLKSDFVATVSHELRTPITPIKGYARLLATRGDAMDAEQRARALRVIEERADHLSRLVDDLLLASKMSTGGLSDVQMELASHDIVALVRDAISGVPSLAGRITIDMPTEETMALCDPTRVNQCLTNMLTNAQKYSPPATPIYVRVATEANDITVAITDAGRGIPADELERIFHRFHRVEDSMTMTTDGSGLGLFITRELARAMGGDVSVVSELSVGSCFTLRLRAPASAASAA